MNYKEFAVEIMKCYELLLNDIQSSPITSIGSLKNTYSCQLDRYRIDGIANAAKKLKTDLIAECSTKPRRGKWRVLSETEPWEKGDVIHYTEGHSEAGQTVTVDGFLVGKTLAGWPPREAYDYVERRVPKHPSLAKLCKRLNKHQTIELFHDGTCCLYSYEPAVNAHKELNFDSIAQIKEYLAAMQEVEIKHDQCP
jgi:hypothetical protein